MNLYKDESVDVIKIFSEIFINKKVIFRNSIISFIIGVFFALTLPNKYTSSTTFIPQISSSSTSSPNSSLSGLASLAGINLSEMVSDGADISPLLYPKIVESLPFKLDLLSSTLIFKGEEITVRKFLLDQKSFDLFDFIQSIPSYLLNVFKNKATQKNELKNNIYFISKEDKELFEFLEKILSISINDKDGFINISVTQKKQSVSAQITKNAQLILQSKIIDYKSKSSKDLLDFSQNQYDVRKMEYNKLQDEIAIFKDKNININSTLFQNKLDRLQSEAQILQSVVQQLASQVEQAKLQVSKDTPVFTVINPVSIPYEKSEPKRTLIVIIFTLLALIFSIAYILFYDSVSELYKTISNK